MGQVIKLVKAKVCQNYIDGLPAYFFFKRNGPQELSEFLDHTPEL